MQTIVDGTPFTLVPFGGMTTALVVPVGRSKGQFGQIWVVEGARGGVMGERSERDAPSAIRTVTSAVLSDGQLPL